MQQSLLPPANFSSHAMLCAGKSPGLRIQTAKEKARGQARRRAVGHLPAAEGIRTGAVAPGGAYGLAFCGGALTERMPMTLLQDGSVRELRCRTSRTASNLNSFVCFLLVPMPCLQFRETI